MIKTQIGNNLDGSPRFNYTLTQQEHDAGYVAFMVGPVISGTVSLPNGAAYDVSETAIPVKYEDVGHMHIALHKQHHAAGRFLEHPVPDLADVSLPPREDSAPTHVDPDAPIPSPSE